MWGVWTVWSVWGVWTVRSVWGCGVCGVFGVCGQCGVCGLQAEVYQSAYQVFAFFLLHFLGQKEGKEHWNVLIGTLIGRRVIPPLRIP